MYSAQDLHLLTVLKPYAGNWDLAWYVQRCEMAGFAATDDAKRLCAERFLAGKRKVSAPGAKKAKREARARRKVIAQPPQDLVDAVRRACLSPLAAQYASGNEKALNALVGMVLKQCKAEPGAVKELIIRGCNGIDHV